MVRKQSDAVQRHIIHRRNGAPIQQRSIRLDTYLAETVHTAAVVNRLTRLQRHGSITLQRTAVLNVSLCIHIYCLRRDHVCATHNATRRRHRHTAGRCDNRHARRVGDVPRFSLLCYCSSL